jgi:hypothetical protein
VLFYSLRNKRRLVEDSRQNSALSVAVQIISGVFVITTDKNFTWYLGETFERTGRCVTPQKPFRPGKVIVHTVMQGT